MPYAISMHPSDKSKIIDVGFKVLNVGFDHGMDLKGTSRFFYCFHGIIIAAVGIHIHRITKFGCGLCNVLYRLPGIDSVQAL